MLNLIGTPEPNKPKYFTFGDGTKEPWKTFEVVIRHEDPKRPTIKYKTYSQNFYTAIRDVVKFYKKYIGCERLYQYETENLDEHNFRVGLAIDGREGNDIIANLYVQI